MSWGLSDTSSSEQSSEAQLKCCTCTGAAPLRPSAHLIRCTHPPAIIAARALPRRDV